MAGDIFSPTSIPVLQEVLNFTQARHGVLAGNIANMGTPGYQVRDLSQTEFQERLKSAIAAQNERQEPVSPGMLSDDEPGDPIKNVRDSLKTILYHDGTNVGLEQQVTEITKNQMLHNLAVTIMSSQFRLLQAAVSERV
jgi:flagellar basal-body rod protein FlgB